MKNILQKVYFLLLILLCLTGCNKKTIKDPNQPDGENEQFITGGEMCNYGVVLEGNETQGVTFPIITNTKINTIELQSVETTDDVIIKFELTDFQGKADLKYKQHYVYLLGLEMHTESEEDIINTEVESAEILVNGIHFTYTFKNFKLCNDKYLCEKENSSIKEQSMLIDGGITGMFGYVPDSQMPLNLSITGDEDYNIDSFYFFGNYLRRDKTLINGSAFYDERIDLPLDKYATMTMKTSFINEDFTESEIIRDAFIIKYSDENGSYLFIYNAGLYIWRNFNELSDDVNGVLKNYIDTYIVK